MKWLKKLWKFLIDDYKEYRKMKRMKIPEK